MEATAKAWTFTARGPPAAVLILNTSRPLPALPPPLPLPKASPNPEEWLLIRVSHTGLNPGALFHMGVMPAFARAKTAVPEMDFSGTVLDVWAPDASDPNKSPTRFVKGDKILGFLPIAFTYPTGMGALQSHIAVPARYAVKKPESVSFRDAAGLMLGACTAWRLLVDARVKEGDRVLINAASGGVGTFAVQLARNAVGPSGLVVAVCSERNVELVKGLGADEVIDYLQYKSLPAELRRRYGSQPLDVVLDCLGIQALYVNCAPFLKEGGVYAAVGLKPTAWTITGIFSATIKFLLNGIWPLSPWLGGTGREWKLASMMDPGLELMEQMTKMLADGVIKVVVDSVWPFEDALKAYEVLESRRAKGKIVVKVDEDVD